MKIRPNRLSLQVNVKSRILKNLIKCKDIEIKQYLHVTYYLGCGLDETKSGERMALKVRRGRRVFYMLVPQYGTNYRIQWRNISLNTCNHDVFYYYYHSYSLFLCCFYIAILIVVSNIIFIIITIIFIIITIIKLRFPSVSSINNL